MVVLRWIRQNWFLVGIVVVIILAKLEPTIGAKGGPLIPEITVKYFCVSLIFFNSGVSLRTEEITKALLQLKLHIFVQGFTFIFYPLFIQTTLSLLRESPFDPLLLDGLTVLGCMPPPVSSAVLLTKAIGGNEAAAVFNSAFGSFLGIMVTPVLLLFSVGSSASVPFWSVFGQLSVTVVLPVFLGQVVRSYVKSSMERRKIPFGEIGSAILLMIIYTTFCDTFSHSEVEIDSLSLMSIILMIVLLQVCLLLLVFFVSTRSFFHFKPSDTIALLFCCTHKSLTLGIPIIKIVFSGFGGISVISIPLLIYHPTQILLGGFLVPTLRGWLMATQKIRGCQQAWQV
ncbi:sodium/bile acid cotransporter 7-like [Liolophura sinensis]|uniref:sodium/bile acid cotransporter 7-like n=1 Tax=Liolophura sinensis TaxID=3198878 RepID=UPI0031598691